MNSRWLLILMASLLMGSCNVFKPFIKNKKKEERKEKRAERKAVRGNLITVVVDSSSVVKKDSLRLLPSDTLFARNLIDYRKI